MVIINLIWFFAAAGVANMSATLSAKILPHWDMPIDFGYKLQGKELFGPHKTWRGLVCGTLTAGVVFIFQRAVWSGYGWNGFQDLPIYFGFAIGFGALAGDLIESFLKRRVGIGSGRSWFPFDQIDWVIGAFVVASFFVRLSWWVWVIALIIGLVLHMSVKYTGYYLKIDNEKI